MKNYTDEEILLLLGTKNNTDATMIALYKKQIAELAACISERHARIDRRELIIQKASIRQQIEFNKKLWRAKDDNELCPLEVGQGYRYNNREFTVELLQDGRLALCETIGADDKPITRISGRDLKIIGEQFYFDFPGAQLLK